MEQDITWVACCDTCKFKGFTWDWEEPLVNLWCLLNGEPIPRRADNNTDWHFKAKSIVEIKAHNICEHYTHAFWDGCDDRGRLVGKYDCA